MYAVRREIENAHIIRERDRYRFRELASVLALVVPVGVFLLIFTWQNLEVIRSGRDLSRLQQVERELSDRNRKLRLDIERLTSLDQVEQKAVAMGLRPAENLQLVTVRVGAAKGAAR